MTPLVRAVEWIKVETGCRTWHVESAFVLLFLVMVASFSGKGFVEWVGVVAVFLSFQHGSVADRLSEAAQQDARVGRVLVECWRKERWYFIGKEITWVVYFSWLGAWSALAGAVIFALYRPWRALWRQHHPFQGRYSA